MPRFLDLFGALKSSAVGGIRELRRTYVSFGYLYALDMNKCAQESYRWRDIVKPASCTPLGVQIQCFSEKGGGFAKKSVENFSPKGRVAVSDGLPIVGIPLNTADIFCTRRIAGAYKPIHDATIKSTAWDMFGCWACMCTMHACVCVCLYACLEPHSSILTFASACDLPRFCRAGACCFDAMGARDARAASGTFSIFGVIAGGGRSSRI